MSGITNSNKVNCFGNSIFQLITGCKMLFGDFQQHLTMHSRMTGDCMTCLTALQLAKLNYAPNNPVDGSSFFPIFNYLQMPTDEQGDAMEFFSQCLNQINPSLGNLAAFSVERAHKCNRCHLLLPLEEENIQFIGMPTSCQSVEEAVQLFVTPEVIEASCAACGTVGLSLKKRISYNPPIILVHNLDGKCKFLNRSIVLCDEEYALNGIVIMKGSATARHYTTVRSLENTVFEFDDERVKKYKIRKNRKLRFYIAMYVRVDQQDNTIDDPVPAEEKSKEDEKVRDQDEEDKFPSPPKPVPQPVPEDQAVPEGEPAPGGSSDPKFGMSPLPTDSVKLENIDDVELPSSTVPSLPVISGIKGAAEEIFSGDELDDTIDYSMTYDAEGNPIIGSMSFHVVMKDGTFRDMNEEEYIEYLSNQAKIIKHQEIVRRQNVAQKLKDQYQKEGCVLLNVNVNQKEVMDHLLSQAIRKKGHKRKHEDKGDIPSPPPKRIVSEVPENRRREYLKREAKSIIEGSYQATDGYSSESDEESKKNLPQRKPGENRPERRIPSLLRNPEENPKHTIKRISNQYKVYGAFRGVDTSKRRPYTRRQWNTVGLSQGLPHRSFVTASSTNTLPHGQRVAEGIEHNCILCGGHFFSDSIPEFIEHYLVKHYKRCYRIQGVVVLLCKCRDVRGRGGWHRNGHHHCTQCWMPRDKDKDLRVHMRTKHGFTNDQIVELDPPEDS